MTRRKPLALALAALVGALTAGAAQARPTDLDGVWRTAEGDGRVAFSPCGASLCGYLLDGPMKTLLIDGLMKGGPGWSGGRILDPRGGRSYAGEVSRLDAERIRVVGCLVRPLCGSQVWKLAH